LRAVGIPVVVLARRWKQGDFVSVDNEEGGRLAARHLLSRGHRRVAIAFSDNPENTAVQDRVLGFRETLAADGVAIPNEWDLRTPRTSFEDGDVAAERLLACRKRPSAVTDRMAMALISRLLERGVRVPEDIAVVGFDDMPYARYAQMPLTTVSIPIRHMGELAASILFEQLDGRVNKRHQVLLQPSLVPRVSCP
jgi:DNA-binding LacI/PurR family transcriptional regulator